MPQKLKLDLDETASIIGNSEQFYQIIRNLVENAIKYTPNEGEITISLTAAEKEITLKIANTGERIPDSEKEKVFERFYRIDRSRSSKIPGTGIGLAIVKQLTELYHGAS
ncbi:ATP-binding protein [Enterococcus avium]